MSLVKSSSTENINNLICPIADNIANYKFDFDTKLGEGRFGKVRLATHKLTNFKVAIKIIDKNHLKLKEERQRVDTEILILKQLNHYNIVKLYSIIENEERIYLIQEYIKGEELTSFINRKEKPEVREKMVCEYFRQIISAIEYLHSLGIAHRDLKPENILINTNKNIKLLDFGLGKIFNKGELLKTQCGSPYYASPEMIKGKKYNGINSDIWSLGIILYLMLFKELPFTDSDLNRLYKKILEGKYQIPEDQINLVSNDAIDLVQKILETNPKKRIKIKGIKSHKWFNKFTSELYEGINIKEKILPIDEEIVEKINKEFGYEKMRIRNTIIRNLYNNIRSIYFMLLEKKINSGKKSVGDLHSNLYIDYINDEKNKLSNYENDIENVLKERMNSKEKLNVIEDYEENEKHLKDIDIKNILNDDVHSCPGDEPKNIRNNNKQKTQCYKFKNLNFENLIKMKNDDFPTIIEEKNVRMSQKERIQINLSDISNESENEKKKLSPSPGKKKNTEKKNSIPNKNITKFNSSSMKKKKNRKSMININNNFNINNYNHTNYNINNKNNKDKNIIIKNNNKLNNNNKLKKNNLNNNPNNNKFNNNHNINNNNNLDKNNLNNHNNDDNINLNNDNNNNNNNLNNDNNIDNNNLNNKDNNNNLNNSNNLDNNNNNNLNNDNNIDNNNLDNNLDNNLNDNNDKNNINYINNHINENSNINNNINNINNTNINNNNTSNNNNNISNDINNNINNNKNTKNKNNLITKNNNNNSNNNINNNVKNKNKKTKNKNTNNNNFSNNLDKNNIKNSSNIKIIKKIGRNENNIFKKNTKNNSLSTSCEKFKTNTKRTAKQTLYKNINKDNKIINKDNKNENLFNLNRYVLDKINSNKKSQKYINLNKNIQNDSLLTPHNKSTELSKDLNKQKLSYKKNSISNTTKKFSMSDLNINSENIIKNKSTIKIKKFKPDNKSTNFYPSKNETNKANKTNNKNNINKTNEKKILSEKKGDVEKEKEKSKEKDNYKFVSYKTNSSVLNKKYKNKCKISSSNKNIKNLGLERSFNKTNKLSHSINNINHIHNINNVNINSSINDYSTINNFSNDNKYLNSFIISNNSPSKKAANSKNKRISVNLIKESKSKDIIINKQRGYKSPLNMSAKIKKKIKINENKNNNKMDTKICTNTNQIAMDENKMAGWETPFDLSCVFIFKNNKNIKDMVEKNLKKKKIVFSNNKEKINSNKNHINYTCNNKVNNIKFNINLVKCKSEYNNEYNNLYILKVKKLNEKKFDFLNFINSFISN